MSLNPFFNEKPSNPKTKAIPAATTPTPNPPKTTKPRKVRSDKTHNLKFPIGPREQMELRSMCKQASIAYKRLKGEDLTQTKFNTCLLMFALKNQTIVNWNRPYQDNKKYMHVTPLETDYREIGGPHGLAIQKGISERKIAFYLVLSALTYLSKKGNMSIRKSFSRLNLLQNSRYLSPFKKGLSQLL